ncbi:unnamed protein product, partial [marine sediment metagenome]
RQKLFATVDLHTGLQLNLSAAINGSIGKMHSFKKQLSYYGGGMDYPAFAIDENSFNNRVTLQALLNYSITINEDHNIRALIGVSRENYHYEFNSVRGDEIPTNELGQIDAAGTTNSVKGRGFTSDSRVGSFFSRVNYNYKDKYLFEANLRRDGHSKFASEVRWGVFPSLSLGWRISEESFMSSLEMVDNLKIRASWGELGNSLGVSEYQFIPSIIPTIGYPFGGLFPVQGMTQGGPVNPALTWETTKETNIGFDM